ASFKRAVPPPLISSAPLPLGEPPSAQSLPRVSPPLFSPSFLVSSLCTDTAGFELVSAPLQPITSAARAAQTREEQMRRIAGSSIRELIMPRPPSLELRAGNSLFLKSWIQFERPFAICGGAGAVAIFLVGNAAVEKCPGEFRIEADRLGEVGNGRVVFFLTKM